MNRSSSKSPVALASMRAWIAAVVLVAAFVVLVWGHPDARAQQSAPGNPATERILAQIRDHESWQRFARYSQAVRSQGHRDLFVIARYNHIAARAAGRASGPFPEGALIVKENRAKPDGPVSTLSIMAMMNDGWFWIEATPNGRVVLEGGQPVAGKVRHCMECHLRAGSDMVYSNGKD